MYLPDHVLDRAARWAELKRWERRELGQDLRRLGLSYREIQELIPVAKGTLSGWCRDLPLADEQQGAMRMRRSTSAARQRGAELHRRAVARAEAIRTQARGEAHALLHDTLWIAGVVAYWSEGSKAKRLAFANSDPALAQLFIAWTQRFLDVTPDRFYAALHLHAGQDEPECKRFWADITGIPAEEFGKSFIKPEGTGHRKKILYRGTVQIRVRSSGDSLHRVMGWIDALARLSPSFATLSGGR